MCCARCGIIPPPPMKMAGEPSTGGQSPGQSASGERHKNHLPPLGKRNFFYVCVASLHIDVATTGLCTQWLFSTIFNVQRLGSSPTAFVTYGNTAITVTSPSTSTCFPRV